MFGLLLPVLVIAVAFGVDTTSWYRDAQHLQAVADRVAASAGPLWQKGDHGGAMAVSQALAVDVDLDHAGAAIDGRWAARRDALQIVVSCKKRHLLAGFFTPGRQSAQAVALGSRLVE